MPTTLHRPLAATPGADPRLDLVRAWLHANAAGLLSNSLLLGGPAAHRRVLRLLDELREAERLTRRHGRMLVDLHRLLTLQDVGDPDREETAKFAEIRPYDPVVIEICLLADSLRDLLRAITQHPERQEVKAEVPNTPRAAAA